MQVSFADLPRLSDLALVDGSFDPLHAGHVAYLTAAHNLAGCPLIATIASDDDVRAKGREPFLPQAQRAAVVDALDMITCTYAKDRPMAQVLDTLRPKAYIKGKDWEGKLPADQVAICARYGIPIHYVDTPKDSSTARLSDWSRRNDASALVALERLIQTQQPASVPWQPVTDYSFEARKLAEGKHPELIKEVFQPKTALDVGCGPGHLVTLLREAGIKAIGCDTAKHKGVRYFDVSAEPLLGSDEPDWTECDVFDLVICREVLEHLTIRQVRQAVTNLCRLSSKFVYVTTRFAQSPTSLLIVDTSDDLDPTHITMLSQDFLRTLFVLEGCTRRTDLEARLDWQGKGRVLVYEVH